MPKLRTIVVRGFLGKIIAAIIFLATYWLCGFLLNEENKSTYNLIFLLRYDKLIRKTPR